MSTAYTPKEVTFSGHTGNVTGLGFAASYTWMYTGSEDGTVKIWDVRQPGCQREFDQRAMIETVALHPNQVWVEANCRSVRNRNTKGRGSIRIYWHWWGYWQLTRVLIGTCGKIGNSTCCLLAQVEILAFLLTSSHGHLWGFGVRFLSIATGGDINLTNSY